MDKYLKTQQKTVFTKYFNLEKRKKERKKPDILDAFMTIKSLFPNRLSTENYQTPYFIVIYLYSELYN